MTAAESGFATPIALDRDTFMRRLIASLGFLNEGILGSDVAGAYIMNVGLSMGAAIEAEYKRFWGIERNFTLDEYAHVIVDLKQKIQGNFSLVDKDSAKVVVRTTSCPFDAFVRQSPSLCFMTSSVFGGIAARNFGYAKTVLHKRIALGDPGCYVTVYLQRSDEAMAAVGKEYAPDSEQASPDIAEQLRLMDQLRHLYRQLGETTSRWDELVYNAAEGICLLDSAGMISFANGRWRDILGVEGNELMDGTLLRLAHPDDRARLGLLLAAAFRGERSSGHVLRLCHRDTTWRELLTSLSPVRDEAGALCGVLGIFHDVTEEREAQRFKDFFLSAASHELRTPITTIKGMTELLLHTLDSKGSIDNAQLKRRLERIQHEADRMALLSTDLLDASRLQTGSFPLRLERQNLITLVADSVARQRELVADLPHHEIVLHQPGAPVWVDVERTRIEQVLANLLGNAVKYSPSGGVISVIITADPQYATVQFVDNGIGIPAHDLPRLFTPFFRGSNASIKRFMGLGLGLYLSKALVEAHSGTLTVASNEGQGATFTLRFPLAQEAVDRP